MNLKRKESQPRTKDKMFRSAMGSHVINAGPFTDQLNNELRLKYSCTYLRKFVVAEGKTLVLDSCENVRFKKDLKFVDKEKTN